MSDKVISLSGLSRFWTNTKSKMTDIENNNGRREILIVSDSYGDTYYSGDNQNSGTTYIDSLQDIIPKNWTIHSTVQSGSSFLGLDNNLNLKYLNVLKRVSTITDNYAITDIVVVGGWNDVDNLSTRGKSTTQLRAAINEFVAYALSQYPNATIMLCPMGTSMFNITQRAGYLNMLKCYSDACAVGEHITVMSDADCILTDTTLFRSGQWVHPNNKGGKVIANCLLNSLLGRGIGLYNSYGVSSSNVVLGNNISALSTNIYEFQRNRYIEFLMETCQITCDSVTSWSGYPGNFKVLCELPDPIFVGSMYSDMSTTVPLLIQDTSDNWHDCLGIVRLFGKQVQLSVQYVTSSGYTNFTPKWIGIGGNTVIRGDAGFCNL